MANFGFFTCERVEVPFYNSTVDQSERNLLIKMVKFLNGQGELTIDDRDGLAKSAAKSLLGNLLCGIVNPTEAGIEEIVFTNVFGFDEARLIYKDETGERTLNARILDAKIFEVVFIPVVVAEMEKLLNAKATKTDLGYVIKP